MPPSPRRTGRHAAHACTCHDGTPCHHFLAAGPSQNLIEGLKLARTSPAVPALRATTTAASPDTPFLLYSPPYDWRTNCMGPRRYHGGGLPATLPRLLTATVGGTSRLLTPAALPDSAGLPINAYCCTTSRPLQPLSPPAFRQEEGTILNMPTLPTTALALWRWRHGSSSVSCYITPHTFCADATLTCNAETATTLYHLEEGLLASLKDKDRQGATFVRGRCITQHSHAQFARGALRRPPSTPAGHIPFLCHLPSIPWLPSRTFADNTFLTPSALSPSLRDIPRLYAALYYFFALHCRWDIRHNIAHSGDAPHLLEDGR